MVTERGGPAAARTCRCAVEPCANRWWRGLAPLARLAATVAMTLLESPPWHELHSSPLCLSFGFCRHRRRPGHAPSSTAGSSMAPARSSTAARWSSATARSRRSARPPSIRVPDGATRVDAEGQDADAGARSTPTATCRRSSTCAPRPSCTRRANLERQLRAYATYGVTTRVLARRRPARRVRAARRAGATAPPARARVFVAGPIVTATTADAARAETDKVIALKPDLLKIRVDDNLGTSKKMPEEAWRATLERAKAARLTLAAHIFYLADATALAQAGGVFIAHSVRDLPVDQTVPVGDEDAATPATRRR